MKDETGENIFPIGVVDSGTNSNGTYIKYADGTMVCYGIQQKSVSYGSFWGMYATGGVSCDFPKEFISVPICITSPGYSGEAWILNNYSDATVSKTNTVRFMHPNSMGTSSTTTVYLQFFAIGKWK